MAAKHWAGLAATLKVAAPGFAEDPTSSRYSVAAHDAALRGVDEAHGERLAEAIARLQAWDAEKLWWDQRLRVHADLIVLLARAGRGREAVTQARIAGFERLPQYAQLAAFSAARTVPDLDAEEGLVRAMLQRDPSNGSGRVRQIYWLMDAGRLMEADAALASLKADPAVRADAGLHLEVQRVRLALADVKEDWREALAASEAIVRVAPDDVEAQRRRVWLIADHGGAVTAAETAAASTLSTPPSMRICSSRRRVRS